VRGYRYHVASLAAVLLALGIGIIVGVALGDRNVLGASEGRLVGGLRGDLNEVRDRNADLQERLRQAERFQRAVTPALVRNRLAGRTVGVVLFDGADPGVVDAVRQSVSTARGSVVSVRKVTLDRASAATLIDLPPPYQDLQPEEAAEEVGAGWARASGPGVVRTDVEPTFTGDDGGGGPRVAPDAWVVMRPTGEPDPEMAASLPRRDALIDAFVTGLTDGGAPCVGVEATGSVRSSVDFWRSRTDCSTVDDIDRGPGRISLVYVLAGEAEGSFGEGAATADQILPSSVGLPRPSAAADG
jgi:hypothetical protein